MNPLLTKFFKSTYRKEPISGFIVILGITDAVIGGVGGKVSLFSIGLLVTIAGIVVRRLQIQKFQAIPTTRPARYRLPPSSSRQPLPLLVKKKHRR